APLRARGHGRQDRRQLADVAAPARRLPHGRHHRRPPRRLRLADGAALSARAERDRQRAPVSRRAAAILVALVALVAVVETGSALTARSRVATDADWEAAAAEVRAGFQPGDVIAFAPAWV